MLTPTRFIDFECSTEFHRISGYRANQYIYPLGGIVHYQAAPNYNKRNSRRQIGDQQRTATNWLPQLTATNFTKKKISTQIEEIIVQTEGIIQHTELEDKDSTRFEIKKILDKYNNKNNNNINHKKTNNHHSFSYKIFQQTVNKIKENKLTINKADKGNIITIENKENLIKKTNNFLNNNKFHTLKSDPTNRFQNNIKN